MSDDHDPSPPATTQRVPTGRLARMFQMGKLGASIGASKIGSSIKTALGNDDSQKEFVSSSAQKIVSTLGTLKGASMKVGQFLSTDAELMPEGFSEQLTSLQNAAPPMNFDTISAQIEAAFGLPIDAIFSYFSAEPIGAASIGQVHRATLADTGQDVAVKIQYPGILESLDDDIKSLSSLLNFGRAFMSADRKTAYLNEIREMVIQEADYLAEAENLRKFNALCKERSQVVVPMPVDKWTRPTVLTMEFMEGKGFAEALEEMTNCPRRNLLLKEWISTYIWMFHEQHQMHADPHPGNFLLQDDGTLVILDFGSVKSFDPAFSDGILQIFDAFWQDDPYTALEIYHRLGFGSGSFDVRTIDPDVLRGLHLILLEPFFTKKPFSFGEWKPAQAERDFLFKNKSLVRFVPPSESIQYLRLLSGIKGLLTRFDAELTVTDVIEDTVRRRGFLTAEPLWEKLNTYVHPDSPL